MTTEEQLREALQRIVQWDEAGLVMTEDLMSNARAALASKPGEVPTPQPQAHADASPWLPIETAPKDGALFLAWSQVLGSSDPEHGFVTAHWGESDEDWVSNIVDDGCFYPGELTHWMPLPPAPDAARQQQEGV